MPPTAQPKTSLDSIIQNAGKSYGYIPAPAAASSFNVAPGQAPAPTAQSAQQTTPVQNADQASADEYGAWAPSTTGEGPVAAGLKAAANLIPSAGHLVGGVASMFMHPIQTAENLGSAVGGAGKELLNATTGTKFNDNSTSTFEGLKSALQSRYGSLENLQRTATNDPVGFGADIATLLSGVGAAADAALGGTEAANAVRGATSMAKAGAFGEATKTASAAADLGKGGLYSNAVADVGQKVADVATAPLDKVGAGISKVGSMLNPANTVDKGLMDTAAKYDITLPASAVNSNPVIKQVEALAAKGAGGAKFAERVANAQETMQSVAGKISGSLEGSGDLTSVGQKVSEGMQEYHSAFDETKNALYDQFAKEGGDKVPAVTTNTEQALNDVLSQKGQSLAGGNDAKFFQQMLGKIHGDPAEVAGVIDTKPGELPTIEAGAPPEGPQHLYENLNQTRKEIGAKLANKFNDPVVSQNTAAYTKVYDALSKDMDATLQAGGRQDLLDLKNTAADVYKQGVSQLNSKYGQKIQSLAKAGQYSKIVPALLNPATAIEDIPKIYSMIGDEAVPQVQQSILQGIFTKATNGAGEFTPGGIAKQIKTYSPEKLKAMLTPEQYTTLTDLDKLSQAMGEAQKISKGSQTAFLVEKIGEMGFASNAVRALLTGDFSGAIQSLVPIVGEMGAAKLINSDFGQKLLTTGIEAGPKIKAVLGAVKKTGATVSASGKQLYPLSRIDQLNQPPQP